MPWNFSRDCCLQRTQKFVTSHRITVSTKWIRDGSRYVVAQRLLQRCCGDASDMLPITCMTCSAQSKVPNFSLKLFDRYANLHRTRSLQQVRRRLCAYQLTSHLHRFPALSWTHSLAFDSCSRSLHMQTRPCVTCEGR